MKLGVMNPVLYPMDLENALKYLSGLGVQAIEIGTGGYPKNLHLNPKDYFAKPTKVSELKGMLAKYDMQISAVACHGNPVHPNKDMARHFHNDFIDTLKVAQMLGVGTVVTFSGCPGGCPASATPNWVTYTRPDEWAEILYYQWNDVLIPYWIKVAETAKQYGVTKIALEMHPNHCVYNPETLLRLRDAAGDAIGANFDPSHLFWQGIDPAAAIKYLGKAIYHFHAKDIKVYKDNCKINGVLDNKSHNRLKERSWMFCTVGDGNDAEIWRGILDALHAAGYGGTISIEHSDQLLPPLEGLEKAITFLKQMGVGACTE
ncbi:MAG: sugar phosphate isomerase/epimerase [Defluviitaleaceae bacterium]|nr:sugar phosphate isomerase/epimerase [Defluviitaleaceae bacterium]